jgi:hypothetical protein
MSTIEERIRAAARAAADTVPPDGVPPLRLSAARERPWSFISSRIRGLAWVAAAVAVVAVVAISVTVGRAVPRAPVTVSPPISSAGVLGLVPRYYVALIADGVGTSPYAVVRESATGATLATIKAPGRDQAFIAVAGAADDRTFGLEEGPANAARSQASAPPPTGFYLLRLTADGAVASLTRLPAVVPAGSAVAGMALSPDGSRLAMATLTEGLAEHPASQIRLYTLATGAARTWSVNGTIGFGYERMTNVLSWADSGRTLAFDWDGAADGATMLLLDTADPGGNLLADSRIAAWNPPDGQGWNCGSIVLVTPDGKTIVCGAQNVSGGSAQSGFIEKSAATGRLVRVLDRVPSGLPVSPNVWWTNASGSVLIGDFQSSPNSAPAMGVIIANRFVALPWSPDLSFVSVAW